MDLYVGKTGVGEMATTHVFVKGAEGSLRVRIHLHIYIYICVYICVSISISIHVCVYI